jgi:tetratricopeptide (TPR) repeat protein
VVGVAGLVAKFLLERAKLLHMPPATSLRLNLAAALVAMIGLMLAAVDRVRGQYRDRQAAVQRLLDLGPARSGRMRRVRDVDPYQLGVSRSRYARHHDPYVGRTVDAQLDQALRERPFTLVVGASKAGKSRTMYEAVRRVWPDATLLVPKATPGALRELFGPDSPVKLERRGAVVVWLDDLDRFLHPDGVDGALLQRLAEQEPRVVVAGTIVALRRERLRGSVEEVGVGWQARQVLAHATEVILPADLTAEERAAAAAAYPKESFANVGIGEQLAAVQLLIDKYRADQDGERPVGWAVAQAAVDWRRVGMARPIPESLLAELSQGYLREARVNLEPTEDDFRNGLAWALSPVVSRVALLERVDDSQGKRGYQVLDFLVAVCDGQDGSTPSPVREATWPFLFAHLPAADVLHVGFTAYSRGLRDLAAKAWTQVSTSGDHAAGQAAYDLGVLLVDQGDLDGAQTAWQLAVDSHHPRFGQLANLRLGLLLDECGDLDGAVAAWEHATHADDPKIAADATALLADASQATAQWLLTVDLTELIRPPSVARTAAARQARTVAWLAFDQMARKPPAQRAWQLQLAARELGADRLAEQLAGLTPNRPWTVQWAHGRSSPHLSITCHMRPVTTVAVGEVDGQPVAITASDDHSVRVWDLTTAALRHELTGHTDAVNAVAATELDGRPVAITVSDDGTAGVWDLTTGALRHRLTGHTDMVTTVAVAEVERRPVAITASDDGTVRVWDLTTGAQRHKLTGHTDTVDSVAVAEVDGKPAAVTVMAVAEVDG